MRTRKTCYKCGKNRLLKMFYKDGFRKDGLSNLCKKCAYAKKKRYEKTLKGRSAKKRADALTYLKYKKIILHLKINGCAICGYNNYFAALDFHHIDSINKHFLINIRELGRHSNEDIANELIKCVLLCSNCHRELMQNCGGEN